jgi:hypothetical protein
MRLSGSFLIAEQKNGSLRPLRDFNERPGPEGIGRLEEVTAALNAAWELKLEQAVVLSIGSA